MQIHMTSTAFYSVTPCKFANQVARVIKTVLEGMRPEGRYAIVDGTSCIGGDVKAFATLFERVIAIELDTLTYQYLCRNVELWNLSSIVSTHHNDVVSLIPTLSKLVEIDKFDTLCLYLDAPWGGPEYRTKTKLKLELSRVFVCNVVVQAFEKNPMLHLCVLKLPRNYDRHATRKAFKALTYTSIPIGNYVVLFICRPPFDLHPFLTKVKEVQHE